jgi:hypothetical protein
MKGKAGKPESGKDSRTAKLKDLEPRKAGDVKAGGGKTIIPIKGGPGSPP